MLADDFILDIIEAKSLGDFKIQLVFSNGVNRVIDFEPFLHNAAHLDIRKYLDPKLFEVFTIETGDLVWNDYELCFPLEDLYEGIISLPFSGSHAQTRKPFLTVCGHAEHDCRRLHKLL
ncbi:MAG: DUF2442 domain-containing protein [Proteobacteria bacterium]|nr:DUF2442 domain-containing protein [Pseudomonadota bacterium]